MKQPSKDKSTVNPVKNLYDAASNDFELGTYEEFETKLQNPVKREKFYNAVKDDYDIGDINNFNTKIDSHFKKKVPTESQSVSGDATSTSESGTEDGFYLFAPTTDGKPPTEGFTQIADQIVNEPVAQLYDEYLAAGVITPTQIKSIDNELERQKRGDRTLWEDIDAVATGMMNTGFMIPLYKYDNKEDLMTAQAVKNRVDFLEALPKEKVEELNAYAVRKSGELNKETRNVFAENSIIEEKSRLLINNIKHSEDGIRRLKESGREVPVEAIKRYQSEIRELQGLANKYNDNVDVMESNNEDVGTFYEELEFLKKNYGGLEYYQDVMRLSAADLLAGLSEFGSSTLKMSGQPGYFGAALEWEQFNKKFRAEVSRQREFIKPMMSVGDIENANDFGKWLLEQSAAQIPVITVLAAGGSPIGLTTLGASASGQKIGEMRDINDETMRQISDQKTKIGEMNKAIEERQKGSERDAEGNLSSIRIPAEGSVEVSLESMIEQRDKAIEDLEKLKEKPYSELEMYVAGLGVGAAEVLSERVSLGILSKGKRTLQAVKKSKMNSQMRAGVRDRVYGFTKDAMSEGASEFVNQIAQNTIDIMYLGDTDVHVLDGTEDALASGMAMGAGMNSVPAGIGMGAKTFMRRETIEQVKGDAQKASDLLDEIERQKEVLDPKSKDLLTRKARNIIKGNNKKIAKAYEEVAAVLPKEDITKLINIDKKANSILRQASAIKDMEISSEMKKDLQESLEKQVEKLREQKNTILDNAEKTNKLRKKGKPKKVKEPGVGDMSQVDGAQTAQETQITEMKQGDPVPQQQTPQEPTSEPTLTTQEAVQNRNDDLTAERIPPVRRVPTGKPKKLRDIISNAATKLKSTTKIGKASARAAGTYYPANMLVRVKRAGDIDTFAHELGHMLDDRHQIKEAIGDDKVILDQLTWYSERGGSNPPSGVDATTAQDYLMREGLAEFIRAYVANPEAAQKQSPELYNLFEATVDEGTLEVLQEFSNDFINLASAPFTEQMKANIETSTLPESKGAFSWLKKKLGRKKDKNPSIFNVTAIDKFKTGWTNSMQIANKAFKFIYGQQGKDIAKDLKPEENFEMMARLFAGVNGKIDNFLSKGLRNPNNELMEDSQGETMNMDYLFKGLDTSSEVALKQDMDDVIVYMVAQRTLEYAKKFGRSQSLTGVGAGIQSDVAVAQGALQEIKQLEESDKARYDRIVDGARRYREFADAGLKYALKSGRLSQKDFQTIKDNNEYYVSLARNKEVVPGEELFTPFVQSTQLASPKDVIKTARGGSDMIKNPYISLMKNTVSIIKESDRNTVMASFINPLTDTRRSMGDGQAVDYAQIGTPAIGNEPYQIAYFNNGNLEKWAFEKDIYAALKQLHDMQSNPIIDRFLKPFADLIRHTVTTFPVFAFRNLIRDTQSRLIVSRGKTNLVDLIGNKKYKDAFETYGGSQAGFYLINEKAYNQELENSVKKLTKKGVVVVDPRNLRPDRALKALGRAGKSLGEKAENVNRMAEFKTAYKAAKKQGMDDYNAGLYAAYQARDLMDFAVAGVWMRQINKIVPFSNAAVQSIKRSVKAAKENPAKFAYKMAVVSLLPQMLVRAIVATMGDDEEYEDLPDYQRDLFYNFKVPGVDDWIAIPKPFELGLVSSIFDRGASYAMGNDEAFEGATMSTIHTLFPFDESTLMGPFRPLLEAAINKDLFRDRDIVPYWEQDKDIELREGTKYASRVGAVISDGFGLVGAEVDPRSIDHVIKGFTTYYGDLGLTLFDIGKEDSRNQFDFAKTGIMKGTPVANSKAVTRAVELAEDIGEQNTKPIKALKGAIKVYYDLDDSEAKKELIKQIRQYAKQIGDAMEERKKQKIEQKRRMKKASQ